MKVTSCVFTGVLLVDGFISLVVKASASRAADSELISHLCQDFSGWSHTSDLEIGTPVATLELVGPLLVYYDWVRESLIYNFYLSVAAHTVVLADPSLRYTSMLLEH